VYAEVKVPARQGRPAGRGRARLAEDGWIDDDGADAYVESMRVAFSPGAELVEVVEDDGGGERYALVAGDRDIPIWSADDDTADSWDLATRVTLALLNELLTAHGSPERAFAVLGGNDLAIAFATPEMARIINAAPEVVDPLHDGTWTPAS